MSGEQTREQIADAESLIRFVETGASQLRDADRGLVGYAIDIEVWRQIRAAIRRIALPDPEQDEVDDLRAKVARVEALAEPRVCHQCEGTGQQTKGEGGALRSVTEPLPTETCHLCDGAGTVQPIAVTAGDLRAALDGA